MKKTILLLYMLAWVLANDLQAQVELADSTWMTASTQQVVKSEFNGDLATETENVSISYLVGNLTFTNHTDPSKSFALKVNYDKTELGVVFFEPETAMYARVTIQLESKSVVVEYKDQSMVCYHYSEITFNGPAN